MPLTERQLNRAALARQLLLARINAPVRDVVQGLIRRYLSGFGPASTQDVAQFALLRQSILRPALSAMSDLTEMAGPDGRVLLDVSNGSIPDEDTPSPPRLMAMWDSTFLAYEDRSRIIPDRFRKLVIRRNGDVLPTVLVDGHVAGVWETRRRRHRGDGIRAFRRRNLGRAHPTKRGRC